MFIRMLYEAMDWALVSYRRVEVSSTMGPSVRLLEQQNLVIGYIDVLVLNERQIMIATC